MSTPSLLILPGDGIGPEVMTEVRKVIDWFGAKRDLAFDVSEDLVGGAAYDVHGKPLADDDTMDKRPEMWTQFCWVLWVVRNTTILISR